MKTNNKQVLEYTEKIQHLLQPTLPFKLLFSKKKTVLAWLNTIHETVEQSTTLEDIIEQKEHELQQKNNEIKRIKKSRDRVEEDLEELKETFENKEEELENLQDELTLQLKNIKTLQRINDGLRNQIEEKDVRITQADLRHNLIKSLLETENDNVGVQQYFKLLYDDFFQFSAQENALKDESAALLELQEIGSDLKLISGYSAFFQKRSIAIAGGFSAGKSRFITSFFTDDQLTLPIGIKPTTAIPTYVLNSSDKTSRITACNNKGAIIDLSQLWKSYDVHQILTHEFIQSFGFNLKKVMPYIFLSTPFRYEHLCFVDTPGYNPSDSGTQSDDAKAAKEFVDNTDALIWVVSVEAGTLPREDIKFLHSTISDNNKPLFIVINKADLKPIEDVKAIYENIIRVLDEENITVQGIVAYSSNQKEEISLGKTNRHNKSLTQFLNNLNTPSSKQDVLLARLQDVHNKYYDALQEQEQNVKKQLLAIKHLERGLFMSNFLDKEEDEEDLYEYDDEEDLYEYDDEEDLYEYDDEENISNLSSVDIIEERLRNLEKSIQQHDTADLIKQLDIVMQKMRNAIQLVFRDTTISNHKN
ncbi:dynamin family protein [Pelistega suis]|uniref:Dynamin N-terminal domain-containing protein n=1 Tax=Pelistega suis TaxID=1631957 RepID=A0A849P5C5_9BURK|nr:dynamin family protein [Pelistega suis]NOL51821.1 hypothetical protein [Pelistega suis]